MKKKTPFHLLLLLPLPLWAASAHPVDGASVVWESPSTNAAGFMPVGNGDLGLNVWIEPDSDLFLYVGKTDAWDGFGRLLKLGRLRLALTPNPFHAGQPFRQELDLREGAVKITAGAPGQEVSLRVWVDANRPVAHVEAWAKQAVSLKVSLESWRTVKRPLTPRESGGTDGLSREEPPWVEADVLVPGLERQLIWYQRNQASIYPATLRLQGLESFLGQARDPLLDRTFGALVQGAGLTNSSPSALCPVQPARQFDVQIHALTAQTATAQAWQDQLLRQAQGVAAVPPERAWAEHRQWWQAFWERSWVRVSGGAEEETGALTRGWHWHRYLIACTGRGAFPVKFNGAIFNTDGRFDPKGQYGEYDADFRAWGGAYWFQNTRHIYWPLAAEGDFGFMQPLFDMYLAALPLAETRTKLYFNHAGAYFPETMHFWGAHLNNGGLGYGWDRANRPVWQTENQYIRHYWQGGLELVALALNCHAYSQDEDFARSTLLPLAKAVLLFHDQHWPRGTDGRLRIEPSQMLETWWDATNPMPEIAGLRDCLTQLLDLPASLVPAEQRDGWSRLLAQLPAIPTRTENGRTLLASAERIAGEVHNRENGELYAVFPYRLYGVGLPELEIARASYLARKFPGYYCVWDYDGIVAAYLGLPSEARKQLAWRFTYPGTRFRFKAIHDGDWAADVQNGSAAQMTLQSMLLQSADRKIYLLPAWPKEWDAEFKLHAPFNTTVECVYRGAKVVSLKVTPESRAADVVLSLPEVESPVPPGK